MLYRQRRRHRPSRHRRSAAGIGFGAIGAVIGLAIASVLGYVISVAAEAPPIDQLKPIDKGTSSAVYAADGSRLGYIQSDEIRSPVPLGEIPVVMQQATVAIEDERFYHHSGIDLAGIVRAAVKNLEAGETREGGSTITQQLVRNLYIADPKRDLPRKIREAKLAEELESRRSKQWILGEYLNTVSYGTVDGRTAVGVEAASQTYFSKPARRLKLEQAALLAGLVQAPSLYGPFQNPTAALERRNEVLQRMAHLGYITHVRAEQAYQQPLGLRRGDLYTAIREPYFFDFVKQQLIEKYGVNTVRKGGLAIHTTIDPKLQEAGRKAIDGYLNRPGDPSAAVVSIDPATGYVKAMASSGAYQHQQFNLAAQGHRQPGSAFKTMVLTAALRRGINPYTTSYSSHPLAVPIPGFGIWKVKTYDNSYGGRMTVASATLRSDNTVYAQLDLDIGPEWVRQTAYDMGIVSELDAVPSEGLGGLRLGVSPLEMSNAYATLAAGGMRNEPIAIQRVEFPNGTVEELGEPQRKRVFPDGVAAEVTKILKSNVSGGTGTRAQIGCPAAGKTGTTDNFNDAWFAGYTPYLSSAVWVGYPEALREMRSVHGISVAGGTFPAQIWGAFMRVAKGDRCDDFKPASEAIQYVAFKGKYSQLAGAYTVPNQDETGADGEELGSGGKKAPGGKRRKREFEPDPEPIPEPPTGEPPVTPPVSGPGGDGSTGGTGGTGGIGD